MKALILNLTLIVVSQQALAQANRFLQRDDLHTQELLEKFSYSERSLPNATFAGTSDPDKLKDKKINKLLEDASSLVPGERFKIDLMVKELNLTYQQAVEMQAVLRRYYRGKATDEIFKKALDLVKKGHSLSGIRLDKIEKGPFVVALDADLTIWDQEERMWNRKVHEYAFLDKSGEPTINVALAPGYEKLIQRVHELGGSVVIYSRNSDDLIQNIAKQIKFGKHTLADEVDGIFTSSHMVMIESKDKLDKGLDKDEDFDLRKDLRILGVDKTIIVDDDPRYLLQKLNAREVESFHSDRLAPYERKKSKVSFNDKDEGGGFMPDWIFKDSWKDEPKPSKSKDLDIVDLPEYGFGKRDKDYKLPDWREDDWRDSKDKKDDWSAWDGKKGEWKDSKVNDLDSYADSFSEETPEEYKKRITEQFETVANEVEESVSAMKNLKIPFFHAYFPYTVKGQKVMSKLSKKGKMKDEAAREYIRKNHKEVVQKYVNTKSAAKKADTSWFGGGCRLF